MPPRHPHNLWLNPDRGILSRPGKEGASGDLGQFLSLSCRFLLRGPFSIGGAARALPAGMEDP